MANTYDQQDEANLLSRLFDAATGFVRAPGYAYQGNFAPPPVSPGVLTEEDAFRQNHARDKEVLDALQMGWYVPRGGSIASRVAADYVPSRLTKGAERDPPRKSIFDNASGIFPEFDKAAPKSGLHSVLSSFFGTPAKRAERRMRAPQVPGGVDPETGERFQFWPERLMRSASTLAGDVVRGDVPAGPALLGARRGDYTDVPGEMEPADMLMERAQDLAGVLGGGPLTAPKGTATLASGAKRPPDIGAAGMTRRDMFSAFRKRAEDLKQPDVEVFAEPRAPLDIPVEGAATPNLPAVQDPLARLLGGAEAPRSNLLDQLTTPPAAGAEGTNALQAITQMPVDRRSLLRGAGAVAANASRVGKIAEAVMKPAEVAAAPQAALPKFEEIWKRTGEGEPEYHHRAYDRANEAAWDEMDAQFNQEHPKFKNFNYEKATDAQQRKFEDARDAFQEKHAETFREIEDMHLADNEESFGEMNGPRYHDYQLPGGENYRELLIKHPEDYYPKGRRYTELADRANDPDGPNPLSRAEHEELRSMLLKQKDFYDKNYFHSSTWDEPNVLGHLRMHDRDIPGVGRSTHLEELNSEWHQEGKQKGYKGDKPSNIMGWKEQNDGRLVHHTGAEVAREHFDEAIGRPPDAPLKDTWPDYLLRRAIKEAVDNNHDAVSWTPGKHQEERYRGAGGYNPNDFNPATGLHDFYDKHLVDRANEIGKQYGTKVTKHDIPNGDNITDFGLVRPDGSKYEKLMVPALRITPQLRKAVKDGSFSLLSDSGKPGAAIAALNHSPFLKKALKHPSVLNTPGVKVTKDGLEISLNRFQKEDQAGKNSLTGGTYYTPTERNFGDDYQGDPGSRFGGPVAIEGSATFKNPLMLGTDKHGLVAYGNLLPEAAWNHVYNTKFDTVDKVRDFLAKYAPNKIGEAKNFLKYSQDLDHIEGNLIDAAAVHAAKTKGYDSILVHNGRFTLEDVPSLHEVIDLRRDKYPVKGQTLLSDSGKPGAPLAALEKAVTNTPNAKLSPDGVTLIGARAQHSNSVSLLGGVHYNPNTPDISYTAKDSLGPGGPNVIKKELTFKNPLVVEGTTGNFSSSAAAVLGLAKNEKGVKALQPRISPFIEHMEGFTQYQFYHDALKASKTKEWGGEEHLGAVKQYLRQYAPEMEKHLEKIVDAGERRYGGRRVLSGILSDIAINSATRKAGYDSIVAVTPKYKSQSWPNKIHEVVDLRSDSGKPGAPLAALEKAYGSVDKLRQQLGVKAGTPEGKAVEGHRLTEQALKAIDDALKIGTSGVPRVSLPGIKRQNLTTDEVLKAIDEALKTGKQLYSDSGKPGAALAALENAPHFFSAVERAVDSAKITKATPFSALDEGAKRK